MPVVFVYYANGSHSIIHIVFNKHTITCKIQCTVELLCVLWNQVKLIGQILLHFNWIFFRVKTPNSELVLRYMKSAVYLFVVSV